MKTIAPPPIAPARSAAAAPRVALPPVVLETLKRFRKTAVAHARQPPSAWRPARSSRSSRSLVTAASAPFSGPLAPFSGPLAHTRRLLSTVCFQESALANPAVSETAGSPGLESTVKPRALPFLRQRVIDALQSDPVAQWPETWTRFKAYANEQTPAHADRLDLRYYHRLFKALAHARGVSSRRVVRMGERVFASMAASAVPARGFECDVLCRAAISRWDFDAAAARALVDLCGHSMEAATWARLVFALLRSPVSLGISGGQADAAAALLSATVPPNIRAVVWEIIAPAFQEHAAAVATESGRDDCAAALLVLLRELPEDSRPRAAVTLARALGVAAAKSLGPLRDAEMLIRARPAQLAGNVRVVEPLVRAAVNLKGGLDVANALVKAAFPNGRAPARVLNALLEHHLSKTPANELEATRIYGAMDPPDSFASLQWVRYHVHKRRDAAAAWAFLQAHDSVVGKATQMPMHYNMVASAALDAGNDRLAKTAMDAMAAARVPPDAMTVANELRVTSRAAPDAAAAQTTLENVLEKARAARIAPTPFVYQAAMQALAEHGDMRGCEAWFRRGFNAETRLAPTGHAFAVLARGWIDAGDAPAALRAVQEHVVGAGRLLDGSLCGLLWNGLARAGRAAELRALWAAWVAAPRARYAFFAPGRPVVGPRGDTWRPREPGAGHLLAVAPGTGGRPATHVVVDSGAIVALLSADGLADFAETHVWNWAVQHASVHDRPSSALWLYPHTRHFLLLESVWSAWIEALFRAGRRDDAQRLFSLMGRSGVPLGDLMVGTSSAVPSGLLDIPAPRRSARRLLELF